jgi:hypothetical protein
MDPANMAPGYTLYDPSGILMQTGEQRGANVVYAVEQYGGVLLKPGLWSWAIYCRWESSLAGTYRTASFFPYQQEMDEGIDPLFGGPQYGVMAANGTTGEPGHMYSAGGFDYQTGVNGLAFVPPSPTYGNVLWLCTVRQDSGVALQVSGFELTLAYMGNPRG